LRLFQKTLTLLLSQFAGFVAAVTGYEVVKIKLGTPYLKPLWGLDIPYIYQTETVYIKYCTFLFIWFLLLCILGVITSLKNKKIIPIAIAVLISLSLFLLVYLNGRYA